jgi:hypothetical protein
MVLMAVETRPIYLKKMLTITVQQMLACLKEAQRDTFIVSAVQCSAGGFIGKRTKLPLSYPNFEGSLNYSANI